MTRRLLLCCVLWIALTLSAAHAAESKLLIVVMDKVTWQDLRAEGVEAPTFWELARKSAIGAMCVRTASTTEGAGAYLTLGAGSRAAAATPRYREHSVEGYAFDVSERVEGLSAATAYRANTGWSAGDNRIVHLGLGELLQQNLTPSYPLRLGLLGETLTRAGLHVACLGNADTERSPHREIAAFGLDAQGRVALGDVGDDLRWRDNALPYRYTTDRARLYAAFERAAKRAEVMIVDLGETSRAEEYAALVSPEQARRLMVRAIAQADRTLAGLLARAPRDTWSVLLVTPAAPAATSDRAFAALTPVIFAVPGGEPALLTSPSTRRLGLVVNTDVAATVLDYFALPTPPDSVGRAITATHARGDAVAALMKDLARNDALEAARRPVARTYATVAAILLWLCVVMFILGERAPRWSRALVRGLLLVCLAAPAAALLIGAYPDPIPPLTMGGATVGLAILIAFLAAASTGWRAGDGALAGVVAVLLVADLLLGARMLHWSTLSYSAAAGARFYGVGNEYGGVLLGGALVAAAALLRGDTGDSRGWRALAAFGLLVLAAVVGWPQLGANLGMALSCAVGFAVFAIYLMRHRFSWVDVVAVPVAVVGLAVIIVVVDLFLTKGKATSHVGLLVQEIRAQGVAPLVDVIVRKLGMSVMLIHTSLWTNVTLGASAVLVAAVVTRPRALFEALAARPWMTPAVVSCVIGAAAAIVLNDSGILAAAMALLYGAGGMAYLGLGQAEPRRVNDTTTKPPAPSN